jgi:hypothetical protein
VIWAYFSLLLWGVLLLVSAIRGGRRVTEYRNETVLTGWMIPVVITGVFCILIGGVAVTYETGRLYGGWE